MFHKLLRFSLFLMILANWSCSSDKNKEIQTIRQLHQQYLAHSPFKQTLMMNKAERKQAGIPPDMYYERQWELTMNPKTGRPTPEKLSAIRKQFFQTNHAKRSNLVFSNAWVERGPGNVGGRTKAVMFDPNDPTHKKVWAGAVSGGLWYNNDITNPSSSWHITGLPHNLSVSSIAVDPNDTQVFYVGTGESYTRGSVNGNGLWKSSDGGVTWNNVFGGQDGEATLVSNATLTINSPAALQGDYYAVKADFGDTDFTSFSGNLALVDDGTAQPTLACSPLINSSAVSGKIAVIERGECFFVDKVSHAEAAGAIGVLMINNVDGPPIIMGATSSPPAINIPSVMISKADGEAVLNALNNGQTIQVDITNNNTDIAYGYLVPGITHINDVITRDNNGTTEIYVSAGDSYYADASAFTVMGHGYQGVYKSVDGGQNWTQVSIPDDPDGHPFTPNDLEIAADNSIWLTTTRSTVFGTTHGAVLTSTDGNSFNIALPMDGYGRMELAVSKTNPDKMYLVAMSYSGSSLLPVCIKTTDAFASISMFNKPNGDASPTNDFTNGQGYYDLVIEVDPVNDDILYIGGIDLFKSTNGGNSWTQISSFYGSAGSNIHPDQQGMAIHPESPSKILFGNDGGVAYSSNAGATISPRNKNYVTAQFYHMAVAPTTAFSGDYFMAGAQDNGTQLFENAPQSVTNSIHAQGGDGAYCFFDQDGTDRYRISNYVFNNIIALYDYNTYSDITVNIEGSQGVHGDFINQEALDSHLNILYSNYSTRSSSGNTYAIRRYTNLLSNVMKDILQDDNLFNAFPTALKVSPYTTTATKLFVGLENGKLLRIDNAQATPVFNDITGDAFVGSISDIEFGQSEAEIYVTIFNYGVNNIFYSNDGGNTWVSKEGDLPDMPVNTILPNPLNANEVVIGTDTGIWISGDFSATNPHWIPDTNGISEVKITDLELRDDYAVYASTFGRGIFSNQFDSSGGSLTTYKPVNLEVYPNPATEFIQVKLPRNMTSTAWVFDVNGREVLRKNIADENLVKINVHDLSKGYYLVRIKDETRVYTAKFILK